MGIDNILELVAGLALFLLDMNSMGSGLENACGNKMKSILEKLTSNRFLGVSSSISNLKISDTQAFGMSNSLIDLLVLLLSGIAVMLISLFGKNTKKWQGIIFIILYVAYVAYLIMREFV